MWSPPNLLHLPEQTLHTISDDCDSEDRKIIGSPRVSGYRSVEMDLSSPNNESGPGVVSVQPSRSQLESSPERSSRGWLSDVRWRQVVGARNNGEGIQLVAIPQAGMLPGSPPPFPISHLDSRITFTRSGLDSRRSYWYKQRRKRYILVTVALWKPWAV